MDNKALVEYKIHSAIRLGEELEKSGRNLNFLVWYYYSDVEEWQLLMSATWIDDLLPKRESVAYGKLADLLNNQQIDGIEISELKVINSDSDLVKAIKMIIKTGNIGFTQAHFSNNTINGIFMKDFIVMRSI